MKSQLKRFFENVDQGKGLVGRIVSDEQLGEEFAGIIRRIDETLIQFVEGEGAIARLIRDPEIGQAFERTVIGLSETVEKINNGDGTIGRLVNDDGSSTRQRSPSYCCETSRGRPRTGSRQCVSECALRVLLGARRQGSSSQP